MFVSDLRLSRSPVKERHDLLYAFDYLPAEPIIWLDASVLTGITDAVQFSTWANIQNNGEFSNQRTASVMPTYHTNVLNGLAAVRFDGVNDAFFGSNRTLKPVTVFMVIIPDAVVGPQVVLGNASGNGSLNVRLLSSRLNILSEGTANIGSSDTDLVNGTPYVLDVSYSATGDFVFGLDGVDDGSGTNDQAIAAADVAIGVRDGSAEDYDGDLMELLVYDSVLDTVTRQRIRDHLISKWGV